MALYQMTFSPTGGVAACTEALAAAWEGPWQTVDLTDRGADRSSLAFTAEDLVLAAVPVYAGRVPAPAAERIARLRGNGAAAVALAVYGNRAFEDALLELEDVLLAAGFRCLAGVAALAEHSIARQVAAGRPDEADQAQLRDFGARIRRHLAENGGEQPAKVPGNRPYRPYGAVPMRPTAGEDCGGCGLCAAKCPVGAIPAENVKSVDETRCISCMRCIAVCPGGARKLDPAALAAVEAKLKAACGTRRENQLFL